MARRFLANSPGSRRTHDRKADLQRHLAPFALMAASLFAHSAIAEAPLRTGAHEQLAGHQTAAPGKMNVLLIIADDLNTRMNVTGFPEVRTPNLDRFAGNAVNFRNAYTQFPLCGPSRASFLTGKRPDTIGVYDLKTTIREKHQDIMTLPEYFRGNGYFSGRVGKVFHQGVPNDIGNNGPDDPFSWDQVVNPLGHDKVAGDTGRAINLAERSELRLGLAFTYLPDNARDVDETDGKVATETIRMLRRNKDHPFFITAGFYRPHVPEIAPSRYFDMYPLDKLRYTPETDTGIPQAARQQIFDHFNIRMAPDAQRKFVRAYYASTTFVDAQVGRVLDAVKRMGLDRNTIVVFISDHGYALGEHGQWQKTMLMEKVDRVPLIISLPGQKGRRTSTKDVELVDLFPTLADLAGLPVPGDLDGYSLKPLLEDPASAAWNKPAFSQVKGGRSVRLGDWRYTEWEEGKLGVELYNERTDPGEHHNLANDPQFKDVAARLKALLPTLPSGKRAFSGFGDG